MVQQLLHAVEVEAKTMLARCAEMKAGIAHCSFTRYRRFFDTVKSFLVLSGFASSKIELAGIEPRECALLVEHIGGLERRVSLAAMEVAQGFYAGVLRRGTLYLGGNERCGEDRALLRDMLGDFLDGGAAGNPRLQRDMQSLDAMLEEVARRTPPLRDLQAAA